MHTGREKVGRTYFLKIGGFGQAIISWRDRCRFGLGCARSDVFDGPQGHDIPKVNRIRRFCFRCSLTEVKRISPVVSAPSKSRRDAPAPSLVRRNCREARPKPKIAKTLCVLGCVPRDFPNLYELSLLHNPQTRLIRTFSDNKAFLLERV